MINARSETVHEKRSFKSPLRKQRCLIPADGYYEWKKVASGKQPYLIGRANGGMLAMAGLWEFNRRLGNDGVPLHSCTILTTSANRATRSVHDRMPVFLDQDAQQQWLDPDIDDPERLRKLLIPAAEDLLTMFPVAKLVGSPKNDLPQCVQPINIETCD